MMLELYHRYVDIVNIGVVEVVCAGKKEHNVTVEEIRVKCVTILVNGDKLDME